MSKSPMAKGLALVLIAAALAACAKPAAQASASG